MMHYQNIKAVSFSLAILGGAVALREVARLPVYFAAYILGSSFVSQMQAGAAASKAAATLIGKITLFPWLSAGVFLLTSLVMTVGFIYLAYTGSTAALNFVRSKIEAGDLKAVKRFSPLVRLLAYLPGPSLKSLVGDNLEMKKFILEMGLQSNCPKACRTYHFAQNEIDLQRVLIQKPIDKRLVELMLHHTSFQSDTTVAALVATVLCQVKPSKAAEAAFVQSLRKAQFTEHSPVFETQFVWINPQPFIAAGYSEMLFRAALEKEKGVSGYFLFDQCGIQPSAKLLDIALEHPKGEALARDLIKRGYTTPFPFHKTASTAVAREFYESKKYRLDSCDSAGNTPLHAAAARGFEGPLSYYRQLGLDIAAKNAKEETPFDLACKHGHSRIIRNLLTTGGWLEGPYKTWAWRRAASHGDLDLLKAFADAEQDLFEILGEDKIALDLTAENGRHEAALWLAEQMRARCTGSFDWINPRYPRAIRKASAIARENGHLELSEALGKALENSGAPQLIPAAEADPEIGPDLALHKRRQQG